MKKLIFTIGLLIAAHFGFSQTIYSYYYTSDSSIVQKTVDQTPTFTGKYFYAADGGVYPIYRSFQGHLFVDRKSKKTGKTYRQYLHN
jgi:hypothetical protein